MIASSRMSQPQTLAQAPTPRADLERKQRMLDAWKSYRGEFQPPLKVVADQPNDNVVSNRCEPIVNKGVSFLFGQELKIEATEEATDTTGQGETPLQDFIDALWGDDDERMTLLSQLAINGAVCGQAFVKLIPPQGTMRYPRIVILDPLLVRVVTSPDDCSLVLAFVIEYPGTNDLQKRQIIARIDPDGLAQLAGEQELDDTWTITNYERRSAGNGNWIQKGEPEEWPYPFPPIFMCQNLPNPNEAWGMPDLTPDLIEQNKVLNFVQSNTSRIIKYHGHPVTYATGVNSTQISIAVDELICLPAPDSKLEKLAAMDNFTGLITFASVIRSDMDEQSRVPAVALGRLVDLPKGNISGVALQLLFQPLIEKTIQKRRLYGFLVRAVTRAALIIMSLIPVERFEDYKIGLNWSDLLPIDDMAAAQTALLLKQLGVSNGTLLQQLGYSPDEEAVKTAIEVARQQAMPGAQSVPPAQADQTDQAQATDDNANAA